MALTRDDQRKQLVVHEANRHWEGCSGRPQLPEPHDSHMIRLLTDYSDARMKLLVGPKDTSAIEAALKRTKQIPIELWAATRVWLARRRMLISVILTPTAVMSLTADLDSPRTGLIRVGAGSMQRV